MKVLQWLVLQSIKCSVFVLIIKFYVPFMFLLFLIIILSSTAIDIYCDTDKCIMPIWINNIISTACLLMLIMNEWMDVLL